MKDPELPFRVLALTVFILFAPIAMYELTQIGNALDDIAAAAWRLAGLFESTLEPRR